MRRFVRKQQKFHFDLEKYEFKKTVLNYLVRTSCQEDLVGYVGTVLTAYLQRSRAYKSRNVCFLTGRTRAVTRNFRVSRMYVRELSNAGFFLGSKKTSW